MISCMNTKNSNAIKQLMIETIIILPDRLRQERKHRLVQDQELHQAVQAGLKAPKLVRELERSYASSSSSYVCSELESGRRLMVHPPKEHQPPVKEPEE